MTRLPTGRNRVRLPCKLGFEVVVWYDPAGQSRRRKSGIRPRLGRLRGPIGGGGLVFFVCARARFGVLVVENGRLEKIVVSRCGPIFRCKYHISIQLRAFPHGLRAVSLGGCVAN